MINTAQRMEERCGSVLLFEFCDTQHRDAVNFKEQLNPPKVVANEPIIESIINRVLIKS